MANSRGVRHGWSAKTDVEKARWFQSLTLEERMELLCEFTELALARDPDLPRKKDAPQAHGPVQVVERT